jgi:phospholipid/cholesterol/gamma-HCH transport system ATP-binding protein
VAFPLRERGDLDENTMFRTVDEMLDLVGLKSVRTHLPSELSTGMKRSVEIARALWRDPEAVVYDEPTTMVDPLTARVLGGLIRTLKLQCHLTGVVVTHDVRLVESLADVVCLDRGKTVFCGTVAHIESSDVPIVRQFLRLDHSVLPEMMALLERIRPARGAA